MKVIAPTTGEIIYKQCYRMLSINPLMMNDYWTQLFSSFKSLISFFGDEDNLAELDNKIKYIEQWISDDYNPMSIAEAEVRMFQNMDLLSGFEVNGNLITQMEINHRLNDIKAWLTELLYEYLPHIRFTAQFRTE